MARKLFIVDLLWEMTVFSSVYCGAQAVYCVKSFWTLAVCKRLLNFNPLFLGQRKLIFDIFALFYGLFSEFRKEKLTF